MLRVVGVRLGRARFEAGFRCSLTTGRVLDLKKTDAFNHIFFFSFFFLPNTQKFFKNERLTFPVTPRVPQVLFFVAPRFWPKGAACNSLNQYTCATLLLAIYKRIVMWFGKRDLSRLPTQASGQFGLSYLMLLGCGFVCKGPDFTRYKLNVLSFFFFLNVSFKNKIMI